MIWSLRKRENLLSLPEIDTVFVLSYETESSRQRIAVCCTISLVLCVFVAKQTFLVMFHKMRLYFQAKVIVVNIFVHNKDTGF